MRKANLIIIRQEYERANHIDLWNEISKKSNDITIIVNIGADLIVSLYKRKLYRIKDALGSAKKISENLYVIRPLYLLRPEISNNTINKINMKILKRNLDKILGNSDEYEFNYLFYGGRWLEILEKSALFNYTPYYYITDEWRKNGFDDSYNQVQIKLDEFACEKSKCIFLASPKLLEEREKFSEKLRVIGNGASKKRAMESIEQIVNSIGIIGNFRDWIDEELFEELVKKRSDLHFGIVGNIEQNMKNYVDNILQKYNNVKYYGKVSKVEVVSWYKKFNVVIVPYKINEFMAATRPLKIVEAVFSETPVVTVPVTGYEEAEFIRFAATLNEFSNEIDFLIENGINLESDEYKDFIKLNSWEDKAGQIIKEFNKV